jgi:sec-independent protein translocase protein TatC
LGGRQADSPAGDTGEMSFFDHLAELRWRLIKSALALALGALVCWPFAAGILEFLLRPVLDFLPAGQGLIYTGLPDAFVVTLKISLWAGALLTSPLWLYQLWAFVAPGLRAGEKKRVPFLALLAVLLLLAGVAFAYYLAFPLTFKFFLTFSSEALQPFLAVDRYLALAMGLIAAFALAFQLPLILMFLGHLNLITAGFLRRQRRYAILAIFIAAAILTPPDAISQCLLAAALMLLYELSILLMREAKTPDEAN